MGLNRNAHAARAAVCVSDVCSSVSPNTESKQLVDDGRIFWGTAGSCKCNGLGTHGICEDASGKRRLTAFGRKGCAQASIKAQRSLPIG